MTQSDSRNYYGQTTKGEDGLQYRLGAEDIIEEVCDSFAGIVRNKYGKIINTDEDQEKNRLMNDEGIHKVRSFLEGLSTKNAHLTKYDNTFQANKQIIEPATQFAFTITLRRKEWEIRDKDIVMQIVENIIQQSVRRAVGGFENDNVSKNWLVHHQIRQSDKSDDGGDSMRSLGVMERFGRRR